MHTVCRVVLVEVCEIFWDAAMMPYHATHNRWLHGNGRICPEKRPRTNGGLHECPVCPSDSRFAEDSHIISHHKSEFQATECAEVKPVLPIGVGDHLWRAPISVVKIVCRGYRGVLIKGYSKKCHFCSMLHLLFILSWCLGKLYMDAACT